MWYLTPIQKNLVVFAKNVPTPAIIYDEQQILFTSRQIVSIFKDFRLWRIYFSLKASNSPQVLKILSSLNFGADVASDFEWQSAMQYGFKELSATGIAFSNTSINSILSKKIFFNFDSIDQLKEILDHRKGETFPHHIGIRISVPDNISGLFYSRFGIDICNKSNLSYLSKYINIINSIHVHFEMSNFKQIRKVVLFLIENIRIKKYITTIDLGGGLENISSNKEELKKIIKYMDYELRRNFINLEKIILEPGSLLIKNAGFLDCRVISKKIDPTSEIPTLFVNASAWMYSPWIKFSSINISNLSSKKHDYHICGNTLFEGDWFWDDTRKKLKIFNLAKTEVGDKILFSGFGSYTMSNYRAFHGISKPPEIVWNGELCQIRK